MFLKGYACSCIYYVNNHVHIAYDGETSRIDCRVDLSNSSWVFYLFWQILRCFRRFSERSGLWALCHLFHAFSQFGDGVWVQIK